MSVHKGAEILAIEVSIDGKKFVFCTVYRVGNLDKPNHDSIMSTIKTFYKIRNHRKIFIVGDFNLTSISWPRSEDMGKGNGTDRLFIDSFNGFGLDQCISGPTHNKGRTLDLMLTNSKNFVTEIIVSPDSYLCKSDHYLLTFEVRSNVKRNKAPIRKILNLKKANWEALNNELSNIHWDAILDCMEPELAWLAFKRTLFSLVDRYIPSISVKSDFTCPWFDAECFEAYRNKDRAHKKFKNYSRIEGNTQNIIQSEINFKYKRQLFKNMCNKKMRDNLYNEDDPGQMSFQFTKKGARMILKTTGLFHLQLTCLVMKLCERILKEELLLRTSHLIDSRQHGFLNLKSCSTNMISFTDNVVMSINDTHTLSTDVVYFDFSKAFDSVNHDLILDKLKNSYSIDGRLLKFLKNYLCEREQSVVLDGVKSSSKPVLSGVPQGSILGPLLFVLFINDLHEGISTDTLYADDTKIWRSIKNEADTAQLQRDVNILNFWSLNNKMKFHPDKCKVVTIKHKPSPLTMLPFVAYHYHLGENLLSYADSETDLGVHVNKNFNFNEQCEIILTKANKKFGILKRTCHFVTCRNRRRVLYLALVRSQFEHCLPVWRPGSITMMNKFESFQKKCLKWILSEEEKILLP